MYGGDEYEDQLIGDPSQLDDLIEGHDLNPLEDEQAGEENEGDEQDQEKGDDSSDKKKTKKKIVLHPQPKLDPVRLTGPRGIATIEGLFRDFKFLGHGHEEQDLKRILERLEMWGNRLFPKYQFDDLLEKVEKLGQKKAVMNFVNKIRMGMVTEDSMCERQDEIIDDDVEMDLDADLVKKSEGTAAASDDLFSQLLDEQVSLIDSQQQQNRPPQSMTVTEEQRQRMLQNRRLAEERRLARLRAQEERGTTSVSAVEASPPDPPSKLSVASQSTDSVDRTHSLSPSEQAENNAENGGEDGNLEASDAVVSTVEGQNDLGVEISVLPIEEASDGIGV